MSVDRSISNVISEAKLAALLSDSAGLNTLTRGIEKESLRISPDGKLALSPHPLGLGSALTHRAITTDFSEAQLELITGVHPSPEACLDELQHIHQFVQKNLGEELLWPNSMPCILADQHDSIPLGYYGTSNVGKTKTLYRRGLGNRYGRLMQTISGIHYNFSIPEALWRTLNVHSQEQRTEAYFGLIRNFRRWSWLLIYLFGASPAVCRSFVQNYAHDLDQFSEGTFYLPFATSLRMGRLGYQSDAQSNLNVSYNSLAAYSHSMREALTQSYPEYRQFNLMQDGEYGQLNDAILQIENEFYGTIRPKRSAESGERPVTALNRAGVEYVEVRCIDLDPFEAIGINSLQVRFLDTFLLLCLLVEAPPENIEEVARINANQTLVVERGREPGIGLMCDNKSIPLAEWAAQLLDQCEPIAQALDSAHNSSNYGESLSKQRLKVIHPQRTPSAKILAHLSEHASFFRFTNQQAKKLKEQLLAEPMVEEAQQELEQEAAASLVRQQHIENQETLSFPEYLKSYLSLP